uniref:Uncharacterized protein n=1 Tax=Anguilla anguilla TaxID=7936 RepID=A0A0E9PDK5_ANGAN
MVLGSRKEKVSCLCSRGLINGASGDAY